MPGAQKKTRPLKRRVRKTGRISKAMHTKDMKQCKSGSGKGGRLVEQQYPWPGKNLPERSSEKPRYCSRNQADKSADTCDHVVFSQHCHSSFIPFVVICYNAPCMPIYAKRR